MVVAGEGEFLLREKLTEFKCGLGFAKTIFWGKDLAKPRLILFEFGEILVWIPPAERGLGNECGRNSFFGGGDLAIQKGLKKL